MEIFNINNVFVTISSPTITYCEREDLKPRHTLERILDNSGMCALITGPSKCGKTVLTEAVVKSHNIVMIAGGSAHTEDRFWASLRKALSESDSQTETFFSTKKLNAEMGGQGGLKLPLIGELSAHTNMAGGIEKGKETTQNYVGKFGIALLETIYPRVLVIDDFHYIPSDVQLSLIQQFKEAARGKLSIVFIAVSNRTDEIGKTLEEMQGRVRNILVPLWSVSELELIARKGFEALNVHLSDDIYLFLKEESLFSPQLMQSLCLELCHNLQIKETQSERKHCDVPAEMKSEILEGVSETVDFTSAFSTLQYAGAESESAKRFGLTNKSERLTVNEIILKAITKFDPESVLFGNLWGIIKSLFISKDGTLIEMPTEQDVQTALETMSAALAACPLKNKVLVWDSVNRLVLLPDPYFLFYLRHRNNLTKVS